MKKLFITGMGRSGTTLLDKLLSSHSKIQVLSQPFPLLFVEVKRRFLESIGVEKYYVLNDELELLSYSLEDYSKFLANVKFPKQELIEVFEKMKNYSGQYTVTDFDYLFNNFKTKSFVDTVENCLNLYDYDKSNYYLGIKEPLCEEFSPYFCENGYKNIFMVRDPRDVLASANYPKGAMHFGLKKPSLFILRTWRKSIDYIKLLSNNKNFHFLKYEDLVTNTYFELDKITDFLNIDKIERNKFEQGIFDQNGKLWEANSSFDNSSFFISAKSVGAHGEILTDEEIGYVEAVCSAEMNFLGYKPHFNNLDYENVIRHFKDYNIKDQKELQHDFSSLNLNVEYEINRFKRLKEK